MKGSLAMDLALAARKRGLAAEMKEGTIDLIKEEIVNGRPPIALLNLGFKSVPKGHFILITGFDDEKGGLYAHSGEEKDKFITYKKFMKGWEKTNRTLLVISKTGR